MTRFMVWEDIPGGRVGDRVTAVKVERTLKGRASMTCCPLSKYPSAQIHIEPEGSTAQRSTKHADAAPSSSEIHRPNGEPQWTARRDATTVEHFLWWRSGSYAKK